MERLTKIIDGGVVFPREFVGVTLAPDNAYMYKLLTRLAAYEDTGLTPEEITDLSAAYIAGTFELAECQEREKKRAPRCYEEDISGGCRYQVNDGDDEPIDRCKRCPLCYVDKQRHFAPPNAPLTLEELREMDREPVFIVRLGSDSPMDRAWALVNKENCSCKTSDGCVAFFELYGKAWLAYRRRPEEVSGK